MSVPICMYIYVGIHTYTHIYRYVCNIYSYMYYILHIIEVITSLPLKTLSILLDHVI